jgi:hypothetical protein
MAFIELYIHIKCYSSLGPLSFFYYEFFHLFTVKQLKLTLSIKLTFIINNFLIRYPIDSMLTV